MSIFEYFELSLAVCVTNKAYISCYYVVFFPHLGVEVGVSKTDGVVADR